MLVAKVINVRLDQEAERALAAVMTRDGLSTSEAVRRALVETEARRFDDDAIRDAAKRNWADPAYAAEVDRLLEEQDDPWAGIPE